MVENKMSQEDQTERVLLIEPFYGGSHRQLIDFLTNLLQTQEVKHDLITLPAKKWHWRARTGALFMSKNIPVDRKYKVLFCSSVLNLAELIGLRKNLTCALKIIYFHENQFVYPQQCELDRDFQYGYNTILSAMVADVVVFNSHYNKNSFLGNISSHLRKQPDFRVTGLEEEIEPKCQVIYFPVVIKKPLKTFTRNSEILHIVWPHRWEHDKNPNMFFETLFKLKDEGVKFILSVLGESYVDPMPVFKVAQEKLASNLKHFGRLESKEEYIEVLCSAHVAVSTAKHEFFGVAMMEAVKCGCYPLVPHALVYPELYPDEYLYTTSQQLLKKLRNFCQKPYLVQERLKTAPIHTQLFEETRIADEFVKLLNIQSV